MFDRPPRAGVFRSLRIDTATYCRVEKAHSLAAGTLSLRIKTEDSMTKDYKENGMPDVGSPKSSSTDPTQLAAQEQSSSLIKGRYLVEKELGRGGIGVVYLARDRQLHDRPVVIKVLLDGSSENAWYKKKFLQEAEALARLDHPCIVGVIDSGETPDHKPFLAMQYVKGESLRPLIKQEGMDFDTVAPIIRQIGLALTAAHEQKIYHCDLKPENIMLQDLGEGELQVKVVDFGIAKIKDSQVASSSGTAVAGTPPYMAPEQIAGKPSASSDIFAMGVIAYEMLTGRRPFNVTSFNAIDTLRAGVKIKPKDLRQDLPDAAQDVILKALSFNAEDRHQRARDFGELLAQTLTADLEVTSTDRVSEGADLEIGHVLFMDIVSYSKLPTDQQTRIYKQLQQVVTGTEAFQKAKASRQLVSRSTGDGMALVFFSGPRAPAECALEIARGLHTLPEIKLRIGINSGPVYRVKDVNETVDVAGAGINMAQRVMDSGDAGHILLSKSVADVLKELSEWRESIHDLGVHKVKHGVEVHLFNLYVSEVGNPSLPEKLRKKRTLAFAIAGAAVLFLAAVVIVWIIQGWPTAPSLQTPPTGGGSTVPAEPERLLSYSLTVQKFRDQKPEDQPFQLAEANMMIFEEYYQVKLNVTIPQPGYFYVLNEAPDKINGSPRYIMLYPSEADRAKGATSRIVVPEPEDEWFEFDNKRGTEKLWLVWSDRAVAELESVKALANQERGEVKDAGQNKAIQDLLARYSASRAVAEKDEANKQTNIKGKGSVIVYPVNLEHR
jgi:serine/threonine protein kinase